MAGGKTLSVRAALRKAALVAFALACAGVALAAPQKRVNVTWLGKSFSADKPPAELVGPARAAIAAWSEHARALDAQLDLDPTGRILLFHAAGNSHVDERMALIARTCQLYDALLPPPDPKSPTSAPAPAAPASEPLPEDPEAPPVNAPPPAPEKSKGTSEYTWGAANLKPDSQCAVMLILRNQEAYDATLEFLCKKEAYLKSWLETARAQTGFTLELPLCGAYIENAAGQEEWNPDNELVHRVMQLLVLRRFGQQPLWLSVGLAWHAELAILKGIYCFPYRDGFVGVGEHAGWDKTLAADFSKRAKKPLEMSEFAGWRRGEWVDDAAHISWGAVDYLVRFDPKALGTLLEDCRVYRAENGKRQNRNGTWERVVTYEIPVDKQRDLLIKSFGAKVLEELTSFFRTGVVPKK
jgi:hypothetical protein